jgi:hypothetical protein
LEMSVVGRVRELCGNQIIGVRPRRGEKLIN